jgi:hypothetical protein
MGLTIFWGPFGLPIPYTPRVTICVGDPIPVKKWVPTENEKEIPKELLDNLHEKFMNEMIALFNKYKHVAGHGDSELEIL